MLKECLGKIREEINPKTIELFQDFKNNIRGRRKEDGGEPNLLWSSWFCLELA